MFKLCWIKKPSWVDTGGYICYMRFDSIEEIISVMRNSVYNGEWIEDLNGNRVNCDLSKIALTY
jgi:hypothetical protein